MKKKYFAEFSDIAGTNSTYMKSYVPDADWRYCMTAPRKLSDIN